jgi:hypothetical protein
MYNVFVTYHVYIYIYTRYMIDLYIYIDIINHSYKC